MMGEVHAYLEHEAPEWTVLRPTWFMQNFSEQQHRATISREGTIYSATGDGRVPFIDADDIAAVAVEALTREAAFNCDLVLTGPAALSYDAVAELIGASVGKPVRHVKLTREQLITRLEGSGMPNSYAAILADMDVAIASGAEDRISGAVEAATGRPPQGFESFARSARNAWAPELVLSGIMA